MALTLSSAVHISQSDDLDPVLRPFVTASNEAHAQEQLNDLIRDHANPIITRGVRLHAPDISYYSGGTQSGYGADLHSETIFCILDRLAAIRYDDATPIANFQAYVSTTVRHQCSSYLFRSRRERCFSSFGKDGIEESITPLPTSSLGPLVEQRNYLCELWQGILELPALQRTALLYNFRDKNGVNVLPLFAFCQIATPKEIAHALNVSTSNLDEFTGQLPMADAQIAAVLDISPRDVINQRMTARRKLKKQMKAWLA